MKGDSVQQGWQEAAYLTQEIVIFDARIMH